MSKLVAKLQLMAISIEAYNGDATPIREAVTALQTIPPPEELAAMQRVCEVVLAGPRKSLSTVDYATEQGENETEYYAQLEHERSALRAIREARG